MRWKELNQMGPDVGVHLQKPATRSSRKERQIIPRTPSLKRDLMTGAVLAKRRIAGRPGFFRRRAYSWLSILELASVGLVPMTIIFGGGAIYCWTQGEFEKVEKFGNPDLTVGPWSFADGSHKTLSGFFCGRGLAADHPVGGMLVGQEQEKLP